MLKFIVLVIDFVFGENVRIGLFWRSLLKQSIQEKEKIWGENEVLSLDKESLKYLKFLYRDVLLESNKK